MAAITTSPFSSLSLGTRTFALPPAMYTEPPWLDHFLKPSLGWYAAPPSGSLSARSIASTSLAPISLDSASRQLFPCSARSARTTPILVEMSISSRRTIDSLGVLFVLFIMVVILLLGVFFAEPNLQVGDHLFLLGCWNFN